MTEPDSGRDERAERAFRRSFEVAAASAPQVRLTVPTAPRGRRRRSWPVVAGVAAAVVAAVAVPAVLGGDDLERESVPPVSSSAASPGAAPAEGMRWVGRRGIEVQVPADWPLADSPGRPDCIEPDVSESLGDLPTGPYVELVVPRGRTDQGCWPRAPRGPVEFGELPVALWQPYVQLAVFEPVGWAEGEWAHEGWTLTRAEVDSVLISVLARPGEEDLAEEVIGSLRRSEVDVNGCATTSPVQARQPTEPSAAPVPAAASVAAVAVCQYARIDTDRPGLDGSRRIEGTQARDLVAAIVQAPAGPGPDRQRNCPPGAYGDQSLVLRYLDAADALLGESYVYYDSCAGNGIVDVSGVRTLTRDNCAPLFSAAPVQLGSGILQVFRVCSPGWD